jgi:hypothetical protein
MKFRITDAEMDIRINEQKSFPSNKAVLFACFQPQQPWFEPRLGCVGFVVDKVALGQVYPEYFGFSCQFSSHRLLHLQQHLSSGAGTIRQLVADVPSTLSVNLTPQ